VIQKHGKEITLSLLLLLLLLPVKFVLELLVYLVFFLEHLFVVSIQIQFAYI